MDALALFIKLCYKYEVPDGASYKDAVEIMKKHGAMAEELDLLEREKVKIIWLLLKSATYADARSREG